MPSHSASQRCLVAVNNILSVTSFVAENNMLDKLGPLFAFTLWISARLLLVHGSSIAHTVSPDILFLVDALARMGQYWKVAERYAGALRRSLNDYGKYQLSVATNGERSTLSTLKTHADMRRCASNLDFLISRQSHVSPSTMSSGGNDAARSSTSTVTSCNLAPNELEYLEISGFFNEPSLPFVCSSDPVAAAAAYMDISQSVPNLMPIHGLTGIGPLLDGVLYSNSTYSTFTCYPAKE